MDHIKLEIEATKSDAFRTFEAATLFAKECMEATGKLYCVIARFEDVYYVCESPEWNSDTTREEYFG